MRGYVTQTQAMQIARIGTRKEGYWNRHLLDLIDFALKKDLPDQLREELTRRREKLWGD